MHNAVLMRLMKPLCRLNGDPERLPDRQRCRPKSVLQRSPIEVCHNQERRTVRLFQSVHRADVRMVKSRRGLRLTDQTRVQLLRIRQVRSDKLQRHRAVELRIDCLVHHTHPANANARLDAVRT